MLDIQLATVVAAVLFVIAGSAAGIGVWRLRRQEAIVRSLREELRLRDQAVKQRPLDGTVDEQDFRRECEKLASRYRRHEEGFSVVVMKIHPGSRPNAPLSQGLAAHAAQLLSASTRDEDTVCRLDEVTFALLLTRSNYEDGLKFIDRVRERLSTEPGSTPEGLEYLSVIAGVCEWRRTMPGIDRAMERALVDLEKQKIALEEREMLGAAA